MKSKKPIGMILFSLFYIFCSILFYISGFLPHYEVIGGTLPFNYYFFGGGMIYFFNSILLLYSSYKRNDWLKEKYLRYLRIVMIIGILITIVSIVMLISVVMYSRITYYYPYETNTPLWSYEGFLLASLSLTALVIMTIFILFYYIYLYTKQDTDYYQKYGESIHTSKQYSQV
ncbi:MAG: hypothetical protein ACFFBP_05475 [Promethearchaeota archaeon]